ncbi:hypothetical protein ACTTAI_00240 (plasmid) [Rhodobacter capsulatus]|uniref:hypothetical protein n=1 Tax=Rhodobacter capsulatus TaxID=1061 RepID=UPI0040277D67
MTERKWTVFVDDNFHFMDEDERYCLGTFDSFDAAVAACRKIVDDFLRNNPAKTADELYDQFTSFGEDPWIKGPSPATDGLPFSAREYAKQRCNDLRP